MGSAPQSLTEIDRPAVAGRARQLRADSIRSSTSAGSGPPTSSMSAADLLAVLVGRHLRYDWDNPGNPGNDHLIFSKGHASPLLYSVYKAVGVVSDDELMTQYRRFGARLEGHPTPVLPWVDVATGSLGQGLPDGVGVGLAGKYLDRLPYHVGVLCGDSEMAEGSIWEALDKASFYELSNLIAIVDVNRLGQRGPTEWEWDLDRYASRAAAFGARVPEIDGHNLEEIDQAFTTATDGALAEVGGERTLTVRGPQPGPAPDHDPSLDPTAPEGEVPSARYEVGDKVATRKAYGDALAALGADNPRVVALDGEVSNSTHADEFAHLFPERYFEMYIAEQQMVASAVGLAVRHYTPFASTFAAFLTRAYDFIRMAAISRSSIRLSGSHSGVEIGPDGPSQMALEDLAMMRAVHDSTVLYPSDGTSTAALVRAMADRTGISYLRTTRGAYPVLYETGEKFPIGGAKVLRSSPDDAVTLIGAGGNLHEALAASDQLAADGIQARVIDLYSVKPIATETLVTAVAATNGCLVVAEDHHPEGGLGSAVADALLNAGPQKVWLTHLAVREMPGSGTPEELLDAAGIGAAHIAAAARDLLNTRSGA